MKAIVSKIKFMLIAFQIGIILVSNMVVFANNSVENVTFESQDFLFLEDTKLMHWAQKDLEEFIQKKYLKLSDFNNSEFHPDDYISLADMTSIINRYFDFSDSDSKEENFNVAKQRGYIQDEEEGEKFFLREEVAIMMCNILSYLPRTEATPYFLDDDDISNWAKGYVSILQEKEIVIGYPDNTFKPQNRVTYAELITILSRCGGVREQENDLEIISQELAESNISIGILEYKNGNVEIISIDDEIELSLLQEVNLALMLPEEIEESDVLISIEDESIVELDSELWILKAKYTGSSKIRFYTNDEKYECVIIVLIPENMLEE